jgi:hypothetical protein
MSICISSSTSQGIEERGGGRFESGMVLVDGQGDETANTLFRGEAGQTRIGGGGGGRDGMMKERDFFWQ